MNVRQHSDSRLVARCQLPRARRYRFAAPRAIFFTLRFAEPRAYSRGFSGLSTFRFLRDARLVFLRSSFVSLLVFAMSAVCFSLGNTEIGFWLLAASFWPKHED